MARFSQQKENVLEIKPLTHVILDTFLLVVLLFIVRMIELILMMLLNVNVRTINLTFFKLLDYISISLAVDCGAPDPPDPNGSIHFTTTTLGSRVVYSCNKCFVTVGKSVSICQANGKYSNPAPVCKRMPLYLFN